MAELLRRLGCDVDYDAARRRRRDRRARASSATAPTTTWSARCAPRSRCSGRSSPGCGRPTSPFPAATPSAPAGSTCTPPGWRPSARGARHPRLPRRQAPERPARRRHPAGLPERGRHRERPDRGRAGPRHDRHRQRRPRARDRRHRRDARLDGRAHRGRRHVAHRRPGRRRRSPDRARRRPRPHRGRHLGLRRRHDPRRHRGRRAAWPTTCVRRWARSRTPAAHVEVTEPRLPGRARRRRPRAFDVATLPYPGFPTDLQPFALAYNAVADGSAP